MSKTLVTHINPHLDDIAAIWLFKKFHPEFKEAEVEFISQSQTNQVVETESEDKIYIGVGRGKFDEHKGDLEDCATSLVWKEIKKMGLAPKDEIELLALDSLVEWVRLVDLGLSPDEFNSFSVPAFIRPVGGGSENGSLKAVDLGADILDRILEVLKREQQSKKDWLGRIEFESRFGKSVAVKSQTINRAFCKNQGGDLFLMFDPKYSGVQFFTPSQEKDLEPIYKKLEELEPELWYLHQSHHMLICGSGSAPDAKPTNLSFEELIEIAKSI